MVTIDLKSHGSKIMTWELWKKFKSLNPDSPEGIVPHHVLQPRAIISQTNIHTQPFAVLFSGLLLVLTLVEIPCKKLIANIWLEALGRPF